MYSLVRSVGAKNALKKANFSLQTQKRYSHTLSIDETLKEVEKVGGNHNRLSDEIKEKINWEELQAHYDAVHPLKTSFFKNFEVAPGVKVWKGYTLFPKADKEMYLFDNTYAGSKDVQVHVIKGWRQDFKYVWKNKGEYTVGDFLTIVPDLGFKGILAFLIGLFLVRGVAPNSAKEKYDEVVRGLPPIEEH